MMYYDLTNHGALWGLLGACRAFSQHIKGSIATAEVNFSNVKEAHVELFRFLISDRQISVSGAPYS